MSRGFCLLSSFLIKDLCISSYQVTSETTLWRNVYAVSEALWLRKLLKDLGVPLDRAIDIHCDNQGALKLIRHPICSQPSKHIDIHYRTWLLQTLWLHEAGCCRRCSRGGGG